MCTSFEIDKLAEHLGSKTAAKAFVDAGISKLKMLFPRGDVTFHISFVGEEAHFVPHCATVTRVSILAISAECYLSALHAAPSANIRKLRDGVLKSLDNALRQRAA